MISSFPHNTFSRAIAYQFPTFLSSFLSDIRYFQIVADAPDYGQARLVGLAAEVPEVALYIEVGHARLGSMTLTMVFCSAPTQLSEE